MKILLVLIPVISAATGWLITTFLIKLLFWPQAEVRLPLGPVIRGLLPRKRDELKAGVREIIETQLLSAVSGDSGPGSDIMDKLTDTAALAARDHVYRRTPAIIPRTVKIKVADLVEDFIRREMPKYVESVTENGQKQNFTGEISRWVEKKIESYDLAGLEKRLKSSGEFLYLKAGAAVIGFVSGLLQLLVFWVVSA